MCLSRRKALIAAAVGAFLFLALWLVLRDSAPVRVLSGSTMGTTWQVQLVDDGSVALQDLDGDIAALLQLLDRGIFSTWTPDSELSRLNADDSGESLRVSPALFTVLQAARDIHARSGGAFDASIAPLVELWGFGPKRAVGEPDSKAIAAARSRLGMQELLLDTRARTVRKPARLQLDLSGIAKGYAVDRVAELLLEHGAQHFLVEVGGELRLQGQRADGRSWRVAIESPDPLQRSVHVVLDSHAEPLALAGSGDYRNFRLVDGVHQSHELDPVLGRPLQHDLAAVTVLADTAMAADAWATALMVLGPEAGVETAVRLELAAYFIIRDGDGWTSLHTGDFARYLVSDQPHAPTASPVPPAKE